MSKDAKSPDSLESKVRDVLAAHLRLNEAQAGDLRRIAEQWEQQQKPLHNEAETIGRQFRSTFSAEVVPVGENATPPASLTTLQQKMDSATLKKVNALRNAMPEVTFQQLREQVQTTFANNRLSAPE